ncbi:glutamate--cysteine ligase [Mucor velutinosus]|uniref:Glutamate--cysteine ligase n=1 Tax=Mucor velutinosus TaxID=708070 RepID=A0AAN7DHK5_9FUNG|nr:glutamate--cysteine ligase [Mucor velutinosus]
MSPKKSNHKVINQEASGVTATTGEATVATAGPTSTDKALTAGPTSTDQALTAANLVVSAAPVGTDAQGSAAATLMEIDDPIVTTSQDAINGDSSASSSSVGNIHGDIPRTSVSTDAINGDASGNFAVLAEVHGSQASSVRASSNIHGNTAASVGDANVDNASATFYHIPVPQGFATPISSDERLTLMNEIERLRLMVFKTTIQSIGCPQGSIIPANLGVLRNQLEMAERTYELVFGKTESTLVPNETPYFQWRGHFFNKRRAVFATPNDCLDHFELVLQAHRLSIHDNWERIVPAKLSTGMARWYTSMVAKQGRLTWSEFRTAVINKYGRSSIDMRDEAREQLERLVYQQGEAFNQFVDKFQQLRNQAEIQDEDCIVRYLIKALPEELANYTKFSLNTNSDKEEITVDLAVNKITAIYNALFKDKWEREREKATSVTSSASILINNSGTKVTSHSTKRCIYHPNAHNHRTKDCKASDNMKKRIDAAQRKFGEVNTRICHDCKEPGWTPAHRAVCKMKNNQPRFRNKVVKKTIVPVPNQQADYNSDDNMDTDTESDEQNMTFAAMNIKDCEYQYMNEPPRNLLNKNSIILPITLENNDIKVRTYFLLDTGSSFSCISPKLAKILEVKINKDIKGTIKTCKKDTVIDRIGSTEEDIKIIYNSRQCYSKLEIFDIFSDIDVVIGMDLIMQIGITISNMAMDWDDDNNPEIPAIDPNPYTPNDSPYGTEAERAHFTKEIEPYIKANKNIDPKAYCNIPGSTLELHILKHHENKMYKPQWPLEEKFLPAIKEQMATWISNGVIQPAPPGTPYNSPIFCVRKKTSTGEYAPGVYRVVVDCRAVNAALDPDKSDRFPLPLISTLHRKMSEHAIFSVLDLSQCFHSFRLESASRKYVSFIDPTTGLQWSFRNCPMGLLPISSFVQRHLTNLFSDLSSVTTNFIDDITVHTEADMETHLKYVKIVIDRLTKANLKINHAKTHFAQRSINILGFCLSEKGLALDSRKVSNVLDWDPKVANSKELQSRLGLINYFRGNLPRLSTLTAPLDAIKNAPDIDKVWTEDHTIAMTNIQQLLVSSPIISAPNLAYPFCLVTDASAYGIGACLYQVIKKRIYYNGFIARKLSASEQRYGSSKRELLAVVYAFNKFRQWLWGEKFHLFLDNRGLLYLHSQEKLTRMIENFYDTIFEFHFDITYCMGMDNILADRLSRIFVPGTKKLEGCGSLARRATVIKRTLDPIESTNNKNLHEAKKQKKGSKSKDIILHPINQSTQGTEINDMENNVNKENTNSNTVSSALTETANSDSKDNRELFIYASHLDIYEVPKSEAQKQELLEKSHLLGHYGITAMEQVIHEDYQMHWKGLRKDIERYVKNCSKCRVFNIGRHVYHPPKNHTADSVGDHWVFDLGTFDVTTPRGNNFILVAMDLFSRFIVLRALPNKTATTVAKEIVSIFSLFGYPKILSHDNGKEFSSQLLESIAANAQIEQRLSLPWCPLGNSACEAAVKSSKAIIIKMLDGCAENWDLYLDGTAYSLNLHKSRLHGMKPFVVMFARLPNELKDYSEVEISLPEQTLNAKALKDKIKRIDKILVPAIKEQIVKTQKADNAYFMKRHKILKNPFPIGASVMIKNVESKNSKTDPKYEGVFYIHGYTKNGSYILKDETDTFLSRDVPTSHIKLINENPPPPEPADKRYEVEAILKHKGKAPNYQYLVTWKDYNSSYDSWETPELFDSKKPIEQYWARVGAPEKSSGKKQRAPKSINKRKIATREERSTKRHARLIENRRPSSL